MLSTNILLVTEVELSSQKEEWALKSPVMMMESLLFIRDNFLSHSVLVLFGPLGRYTERIVKVLLLILNCIEHEKVFSMMRGMGLIIDI